MAEAVDQTLRDLVEGTTTRSSFAVDEAQMAAFARLSGDENPLHLDEDFAAARGFRGRVVYGGLIIAAVSRLLGMEMPGRSGMWTGIRLTFSSPLYIGETATVTAEITHCSDAVRALEISLRVEAADRMIATGVAEAVVFAL